MATCAAPCSSKIRQQALHRHGVGRGVDRGIERAGKTAAERADHGAAPRRLIERLRQQLRAGGLAVGAGNADHHQPARGRAVKTVRDHADLVAQAGDAERRHRRAAQPITVVGFIDDRAGARGHRVADVIASVRHHARHRQEQIARLHASAVGLQAAHLAVGHARHAHHPVEQFTQIRIAGRVIRSPARFSRSGGAFPCAAHRAGCRAGAARRSSHGRTPARPLRRRSRRRAPVRPR